MLISELAQLTGVSVHALRHYEKTGLLCPHRLANGYRDYPSSARREVVFIAMSRELGFSLPSIAENLQAWRSGRMGPGGLADAVQARAHEIDAQIAVLQAQRDRALAHADWLRARQAEQDQVRLAKATATTTAHKPWPRVHSTVGGSTPPHRSPPQEIEHDRDPS